MKHARGFTLVEVLLAIGLFAVLSVMTAAPIRILLSEMPRSERDYQEYLVVNGMLKDMRSDIAAAQKLDIVEDPFMDRRIIDIDKGREQITYDTWDGGVMRTVADREPNSLMNRSIYYYDLPHLDMNIQTVLRDGQVAGLAVETALERVVLGDSLRNFERADVFFAGLWPEAYHEE